MPVIAMTREMGSAGRELAERVAEEMGLTLILHELVEHDLAEYLHVPESAVHHRLEGGATLLERLRIGSKRLARYTTEEVLDLAKRGNVLIRGWGACVILRDVPHVARIRVCTPMLVRERTVMADSHLADRSAARRQIDENDAAHQKILHAAYGVDRTESMLYDLVLNSERVSVDTCVGLVRNLVARPEFEETESSRSILNDKALEAHIERKLRERFTVGMGVTGIDATVNDGKVVLTGKAIHRTLAEEASKLAAEVASVKEVQNRMEVVHGLRRP